MELHSEIHSEEKGDDIHLDSVLQPGCFKPPHSFQFMILNSPRILRVGIHTNPRLLSAYEAPLFIVANVH